TSRQPVSSPTSSPRVRYSSTELIIIFVRLSDPRSWPTRPAEWNVEPLVSSARSTRTTSRQPSFVSQYRIEQPPTPPPTPPTRARVFTDTFLLGGDVRGGEPTVDEERRAGHVRRLVARQEQSAVHDLARLAQTACRPVDAAPFERGRVVTEDVEQ